MQSFSDSYLDTFQAIISQDVRISNDDGPIAISTPLGSVFLGGESRTNYVQTNFMVKETESLSNTVEWFWSLESYGTCQKDDYKNEKL